MQKEEEESDRTPSSKEENQDPHYQETKKEETTKISSPEIEEESPTFGSEKSSTLTDDSMKINEDQDQEKHSVDQSSKQEIHEESNKIESPSFYSNLSFKKNKKASKKIESEEKISTPASSTSTSSTSQPTFSKSKSYSNGASHLFRNLITCGAVDTNDSAMVSINRRNKPSLNKNLSSSIKQDDESYVAKELQKGDKLGGSQRIFGTKWNQQRQNSGR